MKITENLKNVMKAFEKGKETSVHDLAIKLNRTDNSIRSTLSVNAYKPYFTKETKYENDTKVITYKLSDLGIELLENDFNTTKENN